MGDLRIGLLEYVTLLPADDGTARDVRVAVDGIADCFARPGR